MEGELLTPALAVLLAVVAPAVVSLIKQPWMPTAAVQAVVIGVSLGFGVLALLLSGMWDADVVWTTEVVVGYAAFVATVAQFVYHTYFRETKLNRRLKAIGNRGTEP